MSIFAAPGLRSTWPKVQDTLESAGDNGHNSEAAWSWVAKSNKTKAAVKVDI